MATSVNRREPLAAPHLLAAPEPEPGPGAANPHARGHTDAATARYGTDPRRVAGACRAAPHYDGLPRTGQRLSRTVGILRAESATLSGQAAPAMGQHVEALAAALHQKLTLVEYFKSDNAVLRNSLTYLTYVGQTLGTRVEAEPAVATDLTALSHVLLRFIHTPERHVGQEVEAALQHLS